jgi:hypothetical protein
MPTATPHAKAALRLIDRALDDDRPSLALAIFHDCDPPTQAWIARAFRVRLRAARREAPMR